eukprot:103597-Chlamydomonas_euryale.AAC.2
MLTHGPRQAPPSSLLGLSDPWTLSRRSSWREGDRFCGVGVAQGKATLLMAVQAVEMLLHAAEQYYRPTRVASMPVRGARRGWRACDARGLEAKGVGEGRR